MAHGYAPLHAAFVRNTIRHDHVECRQAVSGDEQQFVAEVVDVADFSARGWLDAVEMRFPKNMHSRSGVHRKTFP